MLESKKEENSPQKRPPRWKIKVAKVRRVFETIRTRNPKLFDGIAVALQVVWTLATTFWSSAISNNTVLTAAITLITCGALCFAQWVLLTNRREREIIEEQEKSKTQLLELKAYLYQGWRYGVEPRLAANKDRAGQLHLPPWSGLHDTGRQKERRDGTAGAVCAQRRCL